jgi:hypothetical protein
MTSRLDPHSPSGHAAADGGVFMTLDPIPSARELRAWV